MLVLVLVPRTALAAAAPEPASAASSSSPYSSAFADYKPSREIKAGNWRALNATASGASMGAMAGMHDMGASQSTAIMPGVHTASAPAGPAVPHAAPAAASTPSHAGRDMHGGKQ